MNTQEMIEIMQAYVQGKMIERKGVYGDWEDDKEPVWDWEDFRYRVKPKKWQPQGKNTLVLPEGVDQVTNHIDENFLQDCIDFGVVFRDYSTAKKARQEFRRYHRLYQLALELNDGWEPDWDDDSQYKYYVCFDYCDEEFIWQAQVHYQSSSEIYFKSENAVKKAIQMIKDGALEWTT